MVKVLIVDDSSFVRRTLTALLEKDPDIQVVGQATNGEQALDLARKLDPDVITLDVEMPRMDGLTALKHIMAEMPCPVIMISSLTKEGADTTLKAMDLGALDFMPKITQSGAKNMQEAEKELQNKIKALARRKAFVRLLHRRGKEQFKPSPRLVTAATPRPAAPPPADSQAPKTQQQYSYGRSPFDVVAIGVSTGGPPAVQKILAALPGDFPAPILIAQHMPATFTGAFATRLNNNSAITVKEAANVENLKNATAYICPGGRHIKVEKSKAGLLTAVVVDEPREALYKPSANVLMESAGMVLGRRALGVTLTGMGNDGLNGTTILKEKGGWAIAQSEASCVVYGMPKAVIDAGLADEIVDLDDMSGAILNHFVK